MSIKISKAAKDLNVGTSTLIEFLKKKNVTVDSSPNARIEDEYYEMLVKEFRSDMEIKHKSDVLTSGRQKEKKAAAPKVEKKPVVEEIKTTVDPLPEFKVVGKIDLSGKKQEPANEPKKSEPKPVVEKAEVKEIKKEDVKEKINKEVKEPSKEAPVKKEQPQSQPKAEKKVEHKEAPKKEVNVQEKKHEAPKKVEKAPAAPVVEDRKSVV